MKTFTIRGIDEELHSSLKESADSESVSLNQWILRVLRQVVGLGKQRDHTQENHDLDYLFGIWSEEDYRLFEESQESFRKIDGEIWR